MTFSIDEYDEWKQKKLDKIAERGKTLLQEDIKKEHYDTGEMYRAVSIFNVNENARRIITDPVAHTNGVHYAPIVRDGRGPIYPKRKKALRWYKNGQLYIRKSAGPYDGDVGFPARAADKLRAEIPNL